MHSPRLAVSCDAATAATAEAVSFAIIIMMDEDTPITHHHVDEDAPITHHDG